MKLAQLWKSGLASFSTQGIQELNFRRGFSVEEKPHDKDVGKEEMVENGVRATLSTPNKFHALGVFHLGLPLTNLPPHTKRLSKVLMRLNCAGADALHAKNS